MAQTWNTIHIFGFGTVQVISDTQNIQAPFTSVAVEAQAVVDNVWANKPADYVGTETYHAINNFNTMFSDWLPNTPDAKSFRVEAANLDQALLDALAEAVLVEQTTTTTSTTSVPATTSTTTTK